jgi:hypothetical protein
MKLFIQLISFLDDGLLQLTAFVFHTSPDKSCNNFFCNVGTSVVSDLKLFTTGISSTKKNIFQPPVTHFPCAGIAGQ